MRSVLTPSAMGQLLAVVLITFGVMDIASADTDDCSQEVRRDSTQPTKHWLHTACNVEALCYGTDVYCEARTIEAGQNAGYMYCRCPEGIVTGMCKVAFKADGGVIYKSGVPYPSGTGKCINYNCSHVCSPDSWSPVSGTTEKLVCACP